MASYHLSATPVQRSKGHSVIAAAAYRAAEKLHDERTAETHDYRRKRGVLEAVIIAPDDAPAWAHDRQELWNHAEAVERQHNGQPAREIRLALPHELTDEQRAELVFDFCRDAFVKNGMIADIAIHRPDRHGDDRNHHAHILLTMRKLDGEKFAARKEREWNSKALLESWREQWADYQNRALEKAGHDARVDHRSLQERGIEREPTTHLGRAASQMERRGEPSDRGDMNRAAEQTNTLIAERQAFDTAIAERREELTHPPRTVEDARTRSAADAEPYNQAVTNHRQIPIAQRDDAATGEHPPRTVLEARQRMAADVEPYREAVRQHGSIRNTPFSRAWWSRAVLRIAQRSRSLAASLASKLKGYWQGGREQPPEGQEPGWSDRIRDGRDDRATERGPDDGGHER
jgi:hypothetical protein